MISLDFSQNLEFSVDKNFDFSSQNSRSLSMINYVSSPNNNKQLSRQSMIQIQNIKQVIQKLNLNRKNYYYLIWPGRNMFLINGLLMMGPQRDLPYYISYWIFQISIFVVQDYFISQQIISNSCFHVIVSYILQLNLIAYFILTTFTDPGIIPRRYIFELQKKYSNKYIQNGNENSIKQQKYQQIKAQSYCDICQIYKQESTKHCYECGNCVMQQNYHGILFNNCLGKRNNYYYLIYVISFILYVMQSIFGLVIYGIEMNERKYTKVAQQQSKSESAENAIRIVQILMVLPTCILVILNIYQIFGQIMIKYRSKHNRFTWLGKLKFKDSQPLFNPRQEMDKEELKMLIELYQNR